MVPLQCHSKLVRRYTFKNQQYIYIKHRDETLINLYLKVFVFAHCNRIKSEKVQIFKQAYQGLGKYLRR